MRQRLSRDLDRKVDLAACSSLFTFLERRFETIRNTFRGTKVQPAPKDLRG
ncbi:MAG: hypothetical protein WCL50_17460 [Spirochaetota bacterium]